MYFISSKFQFFFVKKRWWRRIVNQEPTKPENLLLFTRLKQKLIIQNRLVKKLLEFYTQLNLTNQSEEEEKTQWKTIIMMWWMNELNYKLQWLHKLLRRPANNAFLWILPFDIKAQLLYRLPIKIICFWFSTRLLVR